MESLSQRLKRLRDRQVWTQEELAQRSGVPVVTISRIETEWKNTSPRQATIIRLAEALGVKPGYLLFGDEGDEKPVAQ